MSVGVTSCNARRSIVMAGKEKERGGKVCVPLVSEEWKTELGCQIRNLENGLLGIRIGRLGKLGFHPLTSVYNIVGMRGDSSFVVMFF